MGKSKKIKLALLFFIYGFNLLSGLFLWLCGESGNILLGIFAILFYRSSLWLTPIEVTLICWLPIKPLLSAHKKLMMNLVLLLFSAALFLICRLIFGNWY